MSARDFSPRGPGIATRLFLVVLVMMLLSLAASFLAFSHFETEFLLAVQEQSESLSKALQISVQHLTSQGMSDESLLRAYVEKLSRQGVKEITILSNEKEVVASSNPSRLGPSLEEMAAHDGDRALLVSGTLGEVDESGATVASTLDIPIVVDDEKRGYVRLTLLRDDLQARIRQLLVRRLGVTGLIFVIGMTGVVALSLRWTRALTDLSRAAARIAQGDLDVQVVSRRRDEIGHLIETFNRMAKTMRERHEIEVRLRRAERASAVGKLAGAVAHEIRNPLNLISLSVDHLGEAFRPGDAAAAAEHDRIVRAVRLELARLDRIVSDFMTYARPPRLRLAPCGISSLIEETRALVEAKARAQGVTIACEIDGSIPSVQADADGLRACFQNLAGNAIQAMPDGGTLEIRAIKRPGPTPTPVIRISFGDSGAGVPEADMERIFEPYYSTRSVGIGLGLAITRSIIEAHGGRLGVRSAPGRGATFEIELPAAAGASVLSGEAA